VISIPEHSVASRQLAGESFFIASMKSLLPRVSEHSVAGRQPAGKTSGLLNALLKKAMPYGHPIFTMRKYWHENSIGFEDG
jgi:hypothetical protein